LTQTHFIIPNIEKKIAPTRKLGRKVVPTESARAEKSEYLKIV